MPGRLPGGTARSSGQDIQLAAIKEAKPGLSLAIGFTVVGAFASLVSAVFAVVH